MDKNSASPKTVPKTLGRRQVLYFPVYRKITGSLPAAILLSQLMYWFELMKGQKFYKKDADLMEETALTGDEIRGAKVKLKQLNFIELTREGVPARTFYAINLREFNKAITMAEPGKFPKQDKGNSPIQIREIPETVLGNIPKQDKGNSTNSIGEIPETITLDYTLDYTLDKESVSVGTQNWMEIAKQMHDYIQAEGKSQWDFMVQVTNYQGDPLQLFSNWAGKASPYELSRWKQMIPKLQNWMKNDRPLNQAAKPFEKPANIKKWTIY